MIEVNKQEENVPKLLHITKDTVKVLSHELIDAGFSSFKKYTEAILELLAQNPKLLKQVNQTLLDLQKK